MGMEGEGKRREGQTEELAHEDNTTWKPSRSYEPYRPLCVEPSALYRPGRSPPPLQLWSGTIGTPGIRFAHTVWGFKGGLRF